MLSMCYDMLCMQFYSILDIESTAETILMQQLKN
jgi:hypothetical protein